MKAPSLAVARWRVRRAVFGSLAWQAALGRLSFWLGTSPPEVVPAHVGFLRESGKEGFNNKARRKACRLRSR